MHESLKLVTEKLEEKDYQIEEIKNQCEAVAEQITENWKKHYDEKIGENTSLKVKHVTRILFTKFNFRIVKD
jgi:hypothetical protein